MSDNNETVDWNNLSDDEFMDALDNAGSDELVEVENIEDTDHTEEPEDDFTEETETNDQIDDDDQDNADTENKNFDETDEENSQAENSNENDDLTEEGNESETNDETGTETDETDVSDEGEKTEIIDYQKEYAKLIEEKKRTDKFFNKITGEFVANGRKTKGFADPDKIIQAQQIAAGYSEKMAAFKQYKPFMKALKEKGFLEDPSKFNLALNMLDGDKEAIKKVIKDTEIDPFELDLENVNYVPTNEVSSAIEIAIEDVIENASSHGVSDEIQEIITNGWDDDSVIELLNDPQNSTDLIEHLESGVFDVVQDRILEKRRIDANGGYTNKPMIQQYREAAADVQTDIIARLQEEGKIDANGNLIDDQETLNTTSEPETTPEWIPDNSAEVEKQEEYKAKVAKENAKTNEARRKATSLSKKKRGIRKAKKEVDPLTLDDDKF
ncbi:MAG: hypothetical protein KAH01_02155, partial [Caldisericia bacterium]|nr:hypothetical protein [Caldisericia bacterium]